MIPGLDLHFHHVGVACRDMEAEASAWHALGYKVEGEDFEDPIQQVRGRFLVGAGPRLELLVAAGPKSPIPGVLARGVKFYHMAYEVSDFDGAMGALRAHRCKLMVGPVPAVAFGGRQIAFFMMPNMGLVEIIEGSNI